MARKKDERAIRTAHRKEQQMLKLAQNGDPFVTFAIQLGKMGLEIRDIPGDGNCLFRALGDQLEGHGRNHLKYRHDVVEFIRKNRADFEPFVEDDVPFDRHISMLSKPGTYAGNDCIVAFARIHGLTVIIHQLDSPLWQVHGDKKDGKQLHISYHNGDHYASIRKVGDKSENPASIKLSDPGSMKASNGHMTSNAKKSPEPQQQTAACTWSGYDYSLTSYSDVNDGVARAYRDIDDLEATVMHSTGCMDRDLVHQTLLDCNCDIDSCISYILQVEALSSSSSTNGASSSASGGLWSGKGTGNRLFGATPNAQDAKPKQPASTAKRKREKKLERKARAAEQRRQNMNKLTSSSSEEETVIAQNMGTLKI